MNWDSSSIDQDKLHRLRSAAEAAWGDDTRAPAYVGHPQPSAGQCYVTSAWLKSQLGGHVGSKDGHYFWVSPSKTHVIDLTGDQNGAFPTSAINSFHDVEDEPYTLEPEQMQHRPGPIIYTKATNPLYRDFRVKEYPDHPRSSLFAQRATAALDGKLLKQADLMGDAFPGQTPQAESDFTNRYFHDNLSDLQLATEEPPNNEYRFFYGNGQLHVSPVHDHDELRNHAGVPANHVGPMGAGYVHVQGGNATWSVESNVALRGLVRVLKDYGKAVGWKWGGLVGGDGQPISDEYGAKKSYWYGWKDGVQISASPFRGALGVIDTTGHRASVGRTEPHVAEGLAEWANDFGYHLAEYPGGGDMTDTIKNKEWPMQFDKGNPEHSPEIGFEGEPQGELTCPYCEAVQPNFSEYLLHMKAHEPLDAAPIEDGHFPQPGDITDPLPNNRHDTLPVAMPLASFREASKVEGFDLYAKIWGFDNDDGLVFYGAYLGGQPAGYAVVRPDDEENEILMVHSAIPRKGVGTTLMAKILQHYDKLYTHADSPEGERLIKKMGMVNVRGHLYRLAAGEEPKDMLQAPLPFVYDIKDDYITVGHPGMKTSDIMQPHGGQFTPGGIVEGYYEPGGKVTITTSTSMPYSTYHMMQLWYWSHPHMEITSLELEDHQGQKQKLAGVDVGSYIKSLTATDGAAWNAYQALRNAGGGVYVVGGAVRDALLQKEPKDIDLMVSGLPPEKVDHVLSQLPGRVDLTGKTFGVYRYNTKGQEVEVALPRSDDYGEGGRRGQGKITVDHNLPVEKDLQRRDFTANSMAVNLDTGQLVDPYGGSQDIENHILRTTHPASFQEDPTRLVRALVASSRHGLIPDTKTRAEMGESAHRLDNESPDALKQQLDKLLESPNPAGAIRLAQETGVLQHMFPELANNFDYDQNNTHHNYPLGEHILHVLENVSRETKDPDVRLAAMLHDIGKPASAWTDPATDRSHFYPGSIDGQPVGADHAKVGADMAENRLRETYNFPVSRIRNVHNLISQHMFPAFSSTKGARKFLNRAGDAADDLLTLRQADMTGKGQSEEEIAARTSVEQMRNLVEQVRGAGQPTDQSGLAINGNDLIAMGLKPGPQMGVVLRQLTNDVIENPQLNDPTALAQRAQEYIDAQPLS